MTKTDKQELRLDADELWELSALLGKLHNDDDLPAILAATITKIGGDIKVMLELGTN